MRLKLVRRTVSSSGSLSSLKKYSSSGSIDHHSKSPTSGSNSRSNSISSNSTLDHHQEFFICFYHETTERWIVLTDLITHLSSMSIFWNDSQTMDEPPSPSKILSSGCMGHHKDHLELIKTSLEKNSRIGSDMCEFLKFYKEHGDQIKAFLLHCPELTIELKDLLRKNKHRDMFIDAPEFSDVKSDVAVTSSSASASSSDPGPYQDLLPFKPKSFRDASLWLSHNIRAARGLSKITLPLIYYSIIFPFENIFPRITFPVFNPSKSFFDHPIFYIGNGLTMYGNGAEIPYPHFCKNLDYELEVGALIVKQIRNASAEEAENAIGGFVLLNDFSDRSNQFREMTKDRFGPYKCKSFGTGLGSVVVTPDELRDEWKTGVQGKVLINGKKVAQSERVTLINNGIDKQYGEAPYYTFGETIAYISSSETVYPGELIGSGTIPNLAGVENDIQLKEGDSVTLSMEPFGKLSHTIGPKEDIQENHWRSQQKKPKRFKPNSACLTSLMYLCFFLSIIVGFLFYTPSKVDTVYWPAPKGVPFDKIAAPLYNIQHSVNTDQLYSKGYYYSPESTIIRNGYFYSSLADGSIRRVKVIGRRKKSNNDATTSNNNIEFEFSTPEIVASMRILGAASEQVTLEECERGGGEAVEKKCGRPLQIQFDSKGALYVADAVFGLVKIYSKSSESIEMNNGKLADDIQVQRLANLPFANTLIIQEPYIYVTMTSSKYERSEHLLEVLDGGGNGALFRYDMRNGVSETLLNELHFPNGMVLYKNAIYMAELTRVRIIKYDLTTRKSSVYIDNLSCIPDNFSFISKNGKPHIWIGCSGPRLPFMDTMYRYPFIAQQLSKIKPLITPIMKIVRRKIGHALQINLENKKVTKILQDLSGQHMYLISEVVAANLVPSQQNNSEEEQVWQFEEAHEEDSTQNYLIVGNVNVGSKLSIINPIEST